MPITSKQGAAFVAALTAENLLTKADEKDAAALNHSARLLITDFVEAAFYSAGIAKAATSIAWRTGYALGGRWAEGKEAEWLRLSALHDRACRELIVEVERYVALPCQNKGDAEYRRRRVREWSSVLSGSPELKTWRAAEERWTAHLNAEAERLTKKREARA